MIKNKIESLDRIRALSGKIIGWRYDKSLVELRSTISQLIFLFDPSISSDNEMVQILLQMLENAYRLSFYPNFESKVSKETYEKYHENKKEFVGFFIAFAISVFLHKIILCCIEFRPFVGIRDQYGFATGLDHKP